MKKKIVFEFTLDETCKDVWIDLDEDCDGEIATLSDLGDEKAMKLLGCNKQMVSALRMLNGSIVELAALMKKDMIDLYEKMEE